MSLDHKVIKQAARTGWEDLDCDLLQQIFRLLPVEDLIRSISLVCRHWNSVCGDVLFWKDYETLDLSSLKVLLDGDRISYHQRMHQALKSVLNWKTVQHDLRIIRTIIFAPHMYVNNSHLAFLARRLPKLKKLVLPRSRYFDLVDFSKIIKLWSEFEDLSIGPLKREYSDRLFSTLGKSCKNLTTLHIFGSFPTELAAISFHMILDDTKASLITENLPKLRVLTIDESYVHKSGVSTILSESKHLLELNCNGCWGELFPSVPTFMNSKRFIFETKKISVEIKRCTLKNCLKWYIASSAAEHRISYTTEELVNQLWAVERVKVEIGYIC